MTITDALAPPEIMTMEEVITLARIDGVKSPHRTVTRYARLGQLPSFRIGRSLRFRRVDVHVFIAERVEAHTAALREAAAKEEARAATTPPGTESPSPPAAAAPRRHDGTGAAA